MDIGPDPSPPPNSRLDYDRATHIARFQLGDCFPSNNPVGKFVLGLASSSNELMLLITLLFPPDDPDRDDFTSSERSVLHRWLLAAIWEMHLFVQDAIKDPLIAEFLEKVESEYPTGQTYSGAELVSVLKGEEGATRPALRNVMRAARLATFHLPKITAPEVTAALELMADQEGEFTIGTRMPSLRFTFAEDVMLNVALGDLDSAGVTLDEVLASLGPTVIAVVHLAQVAIDQWLGGRAGVRIDPIDG
jgi:hypothetical protein